MLLYLMVTYLCTICDPLVYIKHIKIYKGLKFLHYNMHVQGKKCHKNLKYRGKGLCFQKYNHNKSPILITIFLQRDRAQYQQISYAMRQSTSHTLQANRVR